MKSFKRSSQRIDKTESTRHKKQKISSDDYFMSLLEECGLKIRKHPDKCITSHETHLIVRNLKNNLQKHHDHPSNVSEFISLFQDRCQDLSEFKHYLFPNILRNPSESGAESSVLSDSLVKILLRVPVLQNDLIDFIFEKATDFACVSECGPLIQMILKCLSMLDYIVDSNKISSHLLDLFAVASEDIVRLEIITAVPDIIGDTAHEYIATRMITIMSEHNDLIPAILDCLSYLCLSSEQYQCLQKKTVNILNTVTKCSSFANFVKFLLMPGLTSDAAYLDIVEELRNALCWSTSIEKPEETVTSQVLTATAIRNSMISSKIIANAWLKTITKVKPNTDYKPINFVIMIILYSTSEEKQKQLESIFRTLIKNNTMNEELLDKAFENFKPIIRNNVTHLIGLTNSLLKVQAEPVTQNIASHIYTLMFSKLEDFGQTIVAELLQLGLDYKQCVLNILSILNDVAVKNMSILKPQSVQMLTLLDRMDNMTLPEIRAVMNLLCGLAYSCDNSFIRDDIHIIISKELASSNSSIKVQGILAGLHAVKYLMMTQEGEDQAIVDKNNFDGDLKEAADIIELINNSTRQLPEMIVFFYDEFYNILLSSNNINKHFLHWITDAVIIDFNQNFLVKEINQEVINNIKLDMQHCLNRSREKNEVLAVNIGGICLDDKGVNIIILSPLLRLVQTLLIKTFGELSKIDALLRCPIVMPIFDIDFIEEMNANTVSLILDCLVHCCNWFRELINAFSSQNVFLERTIIFKRISQICMLENLIGQMLLKNSFTYKPPAQGLRLNASNNGVLRKNSSKKQNIDRKRKTSKRTQEDALLPETIPTQLSHNNNIIIKNKLGQIQNITFRPLSLNILNLLGDNLTEEDEETGLSVDILIFILKCVNTNLEIKLVSRVKKNTFLTKHNITEPYNCIEAKECAQSVNNILPKLIELVKFITSYLDNFLDNNDNEGEYRIQSEKIYKHTLSLEYIYNILTIYFKWIGFKTQNKSLLRSSLRSITSLDSKSSMLLKKVILSVVEYFQAHEKYCIQLSTAVSLIEIISSVLEHSSEDIVQKILTNLAQHFLSKEWKNPSGVIEKGIIYNQSIDNLLNIYLKNIEICQLKNIVSSLIDDIKNMLKDRINNLDSLKSINKANLPILYKHLCSTLLESTKTFLSNNRNNAEHLKLWCDVVSILKCLSDLAKLLQVRIVFVAFFKISLPIIRLFLSQGIPILELEFKGQKKEIQELLSTLQQSTRFLQTLCYHFKANKDKPLLSKVPYMKQLLETLICKVKTVLVANGSDEFWLGVLKNRNIKGDVIATQESRESEEVADDYDEQSPKEESDDEDNEILGSDSKSISDII